MLHFRESRLCNLNAQRRNNPIICHPLPYHLLHNGEEPTDSYRSYSPDSSQHLIRHRRIGGHRGIIPPKNGWTDLRVRHTQCLLPPSRIYANNCHTPIYFMSVVDVQHWLGHSQPSTTLNFYAHIDATSKLRVCQSIESALSFDENKEEF